MCLITDSRDTGYYDNNRSDSLHLLFSLTAPLENMSLKTSRWQSQRQGKRVMVFGRTHGNTRGRAVNLQSERVCVIKGRGTR